jgi:hypothetical protein
MGPVHYIRPFLHIQLLLFFSLPERALPFKKKKKHVYWGRHAQTQRGRTNKG